MPASAVSDFSVDAAQKALARRSVLLGREVVFFENTDSTNIRAARFALEGSPEGLVVVADQQSEGRGRLGRTWFSPPGRNLYLSAVVRPALPVSEVAVLTLLAAVACARALRRLTPVEVSIKWPNDLVVGDRKLGGILTELSARNNTVSHAVIGIGVNVNMTAAEVPDEIRPLATSLREETGRPLSRTDLLVEILADLDRWYRVFTAGGKALVLAEWMRLDTTVGREVLVAAPSGTLTGTAEAVDGGGRLILRLPDGSVTAVSSGDVTVLNQL